MADEKMRLEHLGDMEVEVVAELGRRRMKLSRVRRLREGEVVELDKLAGERFAVSINGAPLGEGESVVVGEQMVIRLTRMVEAANGEKG